MAKHTLNKQDLQNALDWLKKHNPELEGFMFQDADRRIGKKLALAFKNSEGLLYVKTDFMTYCEMNQFLRGYMFKAEKRF